jgi:hypothetical protein
MCVYWRRGFFPRCRIFLSSVCVWGGPSCSPHRASSRPLSAYPRSARASAASTRCTRLPSIRRARRRHTRRGGGATTGSSRRVWRRLRARRRALPPCGLARRARAHRRRPPAHRASAFPFAGLRRSVQARVQEEGKDDEEGDAAHGVQGVQVQDAAAAEALQAL